MCVCVCVCVCAQPHLRRCNQLINKIIICNLPLCLLTEFGELPRLIRRLAKLSLSNWLPGGTLSKASHNADWLLEFWSSRSRLSFSSKTVNTWLLLASTATWRGVLKITQKTSDMNRFLFLNITHEIAFKARKCTLFPHTCHCYFVH